MHFVVYGRWDHGSPVPHEVAARAADEFRPDQAVCAWVHPENQEHHLGISFDVDAASFEEAIEVGRAEVVAAAERICLAGRLTEVVSMTDEAYCTWSA